MKNRKELTWDEMVELYENDQKENLPQSFIQQYEKGYGYILTPAYIQIVIQRFGYNKDIEVNGINGKVKLNNVEANLYSRLVELEECFQLTYDKYPFREGLSIEDNEVFDKFLLEYDEIKGWFRSESEL